MNKYGIKFLRYMVAKLNSQIGLKTQIGLKSCQLKTNKYKHADQNMTIY